MILNSAYSHPGNVKVPAIAELGAAVKIGEIEYIVVHIDDAKQLVYVGRKYWTKDISYAYSSGSLYIDVFLKYCEKFYQDEIPIEYKKSDVLITPDEGYGCPVFLPTLTQVTNGFSYYNSDVKRMYTAENETTGHEWAIQVDGRWGFVYKSGSTVSSARVWSSATGFRPHLAIKRKAFA